MYENYEPHEVSLAQEFVHKLRDYDSMNYHLGNARIFKESFLRKQLTEVLSKPHHEIRTNRAAYFVWRIKHYRTDDDLRS